MSSGNHIKILKYARRIRTFVGHTKIVSSISLSSDFKLLASGSYDNTIKLWKTSDKTLIRTFIGHSGVINSVAFSVNGKYIASGSDDMTIKLWNVLDGTLIHTMEGHTKCVYYVSFGFSDTIIASLSYDKTIKLWNINGMPIKTIYCAYSSTLAVSFDGYLLAYESKNGIEILNVSDGTLKYLLTGEVNDIRSISFSFDGEFLISGTYGGIINLWNISERGIVRTLEYSRPKLSTLVFSLNNEYVIAGYENGTVRTCDIFEKESKIQDIFHDSSIWSIAVPSCLGVMNSILQRKKTLRTGFFFGGNSSLLCKHHYGFGSFNECFILL